MNWTSTKLKNFVLQRKLSKKVKKQSPEQEIFTNPKSNKGPYAEYISHSQKLNNQKINNPIKNQKNKDAHHC